MRNFLRNAALLSLFIVGATLQLSARHEVNDDDYKKRLIAHFNEKGIDIKQDVFQNL